MSDNIYIHPYNLPEHLRYANWRELTTAVFDLETTDLVNEDGSVPDTFRITEFCCHLYKGEERIDECSFLVNPGIEIPEKIEKYTGITNEMVADLAQWGEPASQFGGKSPAQHALDFMMQADIMCAYNGMTFDFPGLNAEFRRVGVAELMLPYVDPLPWARVRRNMKSGNKLQDECRRFGVSIMAQVAAGEKSFHRADVDVAALADYLWKAREKGWPFALETLLQDQEKHYIECVKWIRKTFKKRK